MRGRCTAAARIDGLSNLHRPDVLCVDTLAIAGDGMRRWETLGPFHVLPDREIPVPGQDRVGARSVESIWQGLKLIDGRPDHVQFGERPHKRPPDHLRGTEYRYHESVFQFGSEQLDLVTARYLIYVPSYLFLLRHRINDGIRADINAWLDTGRDVVFYDWDHNMDIDNPWSSFSHSALLARWFSGQPGWAV